MKHIAILPIAALALSANFAHAEIDPKIAELANSKLKALMSDPLVISSIKAQNEANSSITQSQIDKLDKQWRAETDDAGGPLIDKTLAAPLSDYLVNVMDEGEGQFSEIFVMDNHGLNVGQSGLTSDYWQGDEAKWQSTYLVGPDAIHVSDVEFDESSQTYQVQVSISIKEPESNAVIGAATFGINAESLE